MISRLEGTCRFPASFLLVAAMNPCPCGYYPDMNRCTCTPREVSRYQARASQALLDRIDLRCDVPAASYEELTGGGTGISSAELRAETVRVTEVQRERYHGEEFLFNSEIPAPMLERFCPVSGEGRRLARAAFRSLGLSARGYHHVIRVARTIADLDGAQKISEAHVSEALCCRNSDRRTGI